MCAWKTSAVDTKQIQVKNQCQALPAVLRPQLFFLFHFVLPFFTKNKPLYLMCLSAQKHGSWYQQQYGWAFCLLILLIDKKEPPKKYLIFFLGRREIKLQWWGLVELYVMSYNKWKIIFKSIYHLFILICCLIVQFSLQYFILSPLH